MRVKYVAVIGIISCTLIGALTSAVVHGQALSKADTQALEHQAIKNNELDNKLYRQVLYFYFSGDYGKALQQIKINRQRFASQSNKNDLFEAGLQVSVGLHNQATQSLKAFELSPSNTQEKYSSSHTNTTPAELLLIAHLQLAEQSIEQGLNHEARLALAKIKQVPLSYYQQYETLSQLAYWPNTPELTARVIRINGQEPSSTAYIKLNKALLHLEKEEYELGEALLNQLKKEHWQAPSQTFWQLLFSPFSIQPTLPEALSDEVLQQQAINDYAQLLLAQLYLKQERFEAAFYELKAFPQHSPYSEAALFMFAYSAQKIKQYSIALKLLNLLKDKYPYSNLGWQSWLMMATQVEHEKSLEQGLAVHQQAEQFYLQQLNELALFNKHFNQAQDVLSFTLDDKNGVAKPKETKHALTVALNDNMIINTHSSWLNKALENPELNTQLQSLNVLDGLAEHFLHLQQRSYWIEDTLALNNQRKKRIVEQQQLTKHAELLKELTRNQQRIAKQIEQAEITQQSSMFANQTEQSWLLRMSAAKKHIEAIKPHRNTQAYQERLKRVAGVLAWDMAVDFPERLWQHKKQTKTLARLISLAEQQKQRVSRSIDDSVNTTEIAQRYQVTQQEISELNAKVKRLRVKTSNSIKAMVTGFVQQQKKLLNQHLLATRHAMASTLEKMSKVDQRIEKQLRPNIQTKGVLND